MKTSWIGHRSIVAIVGLFSIVVAGLSTTAAAGSTTSAKKAGGKLSVVILGSQTGDLASFSVPAINGIITAIDDVNGSGGIHGRTISYKVLDDQSVSTEAEATAREAVSDHPTAIFDVSEGNLLAARTQTYTSAAIPVLANEASFTPLYPWLYSDITTAAQSAAGLFKPGAELIGGSYSGKKVALVFINSSGALPTAAALASEIKAAGGSVTSTQLFTAGSPSFASGAANIVSQSPNLVISGDTSADTVIEAKAIIAAGYKGPIEVGSSASDDTTLETIGSSQVAGGRLFNYPAPGTQVAKLASKYHETNGVDTSGFAAGWVLGETLAKGLSACGSNCSPSALEASLNKLGTFTVPGGVTSFDPQKITAKVHNTTTDMQLFTYDSKTHGTTTRGKPVSLGGPDYSS